VPVLLWELAAEASQFAARREPHTKGVASRRPDWADGASSLQSCFGMGLLGIERDQARPRCSARGEIATAKVQARQGSAAIGHTAHTVDPRKQTAQVGRTEVQRTRSSLVRMVKTEVATANHGLRQKNRVPLAVADHNAVDSLPWRRANFVPVHTGLAPAADRMDLAAVSMDQTAPGRAEGMAAYIVAH
jgi:hypothetical protein